MTAAAPSTLAARARDVALFAALALALLVGLNLFLRAALEGSALYEGAQGKLTLTRAELTRRWEGARAALGGAAPLDLLLVGLSSLRDGVDAPALTAALQARRPGARALSLTGSGGSLEGLAYFMGGPLRDAALRARVVVVGVHPLWLAGWTPLRGEEGGARALGRGALWGLTHRLAFSQAWRALTDAGREAWLLGALGAPRAALYPPAADPWSYAPVARPAAVASEALLARQWAEWARMGRLDPARYAEVGAGQAAALRGLLGELRGRAGRVWVVLMPERARLRAALPPAARQLLSDAVERALGAGALLDAAALAPDEELYDYVHLNAAGRARLTAWLSALAGR